MFCKVLSNSKECLSIYPGPKPQIAFCNILTPSLPIKNSQGVNPGITKRKKKEQIGRGSAFFALPISSEGIARVIFLPHLDYYCVFVLTVWVLVCPSKCLGRGT